MRSFLFAFLTWMGMNKIVSENHDKSRYMPYNVFRYIYKYNICYESESTQNKDSKWSDIVFIKFNLIFFFDIKKNKYKYVKWNKETHTL